MYLYNFFVITFIIFDTINVSAYCKISKKVLLYNKKGANMKFISWNVNGLRAAMQKGFKEYFDNVDADFFCIQETKMQKEQATFEMNGYFEYWNCADKKGYSGTLIYTKHKPINVIYGINIDNIEGLYNDEGRVITLEFEKFYMITIYTPNAKRELERLDYRMIWEEEFRKYIKQKRRRFVFLSLSFIIFNLSIILSSPILVL